MKIRKRKKNERRNFVNATRDRQALETITPAQLEYVKGSVDKLAQMASEERGLMPDIQRRLALRGRTIQRQQLHGWLHPKPKLRTRPLNDVGHLLLEILVDIEAERAGQGEVNL